VTHLIQIFLPLADNDGNRFQRALYDEVSEELLRTFDGFTAYPHAPANGLWRSPDDAVQQDEVLVYDVIVTRMDRTWWTAYRRKLEQRFQQDRLHIRAIETEIL
jgi:hypothetical protein